MMADESSGYITPITAEHISQDFTDVTVVHTSEYNVLARSQRYGRWYMLKQLAGTANYMAPEQAAVAKPDLRNDIYSLSVVMSEMPLPRYYQKVLSRCMMPLEKRYQSIEEMRADIGRQQTTKVRMLYWGVTAAFIVLLGIVALLMWRVQAMDNELNRVANAKTAALKALQEEMDRTRLIAHTDTLTMWKYRWPDLTQRVMAVNQFCYDYTDRLSEEYFSLSERDRILEAMLSEWQRWQQQVNALSTAKVADERRAETLVESEE